MKPYMPLLERVESEATITVEESINEFAWMPASDPVGLDRRLIRAQLELLTRLRREGHLRGVNP
jgi:hypothetical protein